jgi:hemerythrin
MAFMAWDDSYSVKNELLDTHHKELFHIFRKLNEKCMADDSAETYSEIIDDLEAYSEYHFTEEEKCMKEAGYTYAHNHMLLHKFYMTRILEIKLKMYKKEYKLCHDLILFLGNWLQKHVVGEDKQMSCTLHA